MAFRDMLTPMSLRRLLRQIVLALCALALGATASAMSLRELSVLEQVDETQGPAYALYYLIGVMEGVIEANAHAVRAGSKPIFCRNDRRLEPGMAQSLYEGERRRNADLYEADMPVELVMVNALVVAYPCE